MNFMHEFKEEYYSVGKKGVGKATESPYSYVQNTDSTHVMGGFCLSEIKNTDDDSWLAQELYEAVNRMIEIYL